MFHPALDTGGIRWSDRVATDGFFMSKQAAYAMLIAFSFCGGLIIADVTIFLIKKIAGFHW